MNFDMGLQPGPGGMPRGQPMGPAPARGIGGPRGLGGTSMPTLERRFQGPGGSLDRARRFDGGGARMSAPINQMIARQDMGVRPGMNMMGGPSVQGPQGPNLAAIQAEMQRRQVGAQLGPRNGALAGYMMG